MVETSIRPEQRPDPYQAVIDHYGEMRHAYWMEIGLGRTPYNYTRQFNQASYGLSEASPQGYNNRVVSAELIIDTGNFPLVTSWGEFQRPYYQDEDPTFVSWGSSRIDWDADDAFTQAMDQIFENVSERIELSETLLDLRAQDTWTAEDRVAWEREVSQIVSEEVNNIQGLGDYRTSVELPNSILSERMPAYFNELSEDIENDTTRIEFDCDIQAVVEGVTLQRIDEEYLPLRGQDADDYKIRSNYFIANAEANFDTPDEPAQHAFIISSMTGNIIEATHDPDLHSHPYIESVNPEFSFEDFVRGDVFEGTNGYVYGGDIQGFLNERDQTAITPLPPLPVFDSNTNNTPDP